MREAINQAPRRSLAGLIDQGSYQVVLGLAGCIALLLLVAPTAIILITSFTCSSALRFPPPGLSLGWYRALLTDSPEIVEAAVVSVRVAVAATGLGTLLAVSGALGIAGSTTRWARILDSALMSPLLLPSLALGLGLLLTFTLLETKVSITTLTLGHTTICFPFILRTTRASLTQLDPSLRDASESLGGSPWFTFLNVTFPLIRGGIAAGAFIAFMASLDNVAISLFLADARSQVLPIRMWNIIENMLDVRAAAASGILILTTIVLMLVMERVAGLSKHIW